MVTWRHGRFGEFFTLKRGYDLPSQKRKAGSVPIISSSGISGTHSEARVRAPGVVTGRYGTVGEVFFVQNDFWPLNTTLYVEDFHGNDARFASYFLRTINWSSHAVASAVPGVNRNTVHLEPVAVPDLTTQRKIASVLSALDDKIENNRRICETLEAQAQAIFKSWFVDFEPWGGSMPKGWSEISLSQIADFYGGYSYKGNELRPSDCAMATIKNFERGGGFKLDGFKEVVPSAKLKPSQVAELFDILVAHTDMTQNAEIVGNAEMLLSAAGYNRVIFSMDLVKVVPRNGVSRFLLGALLKNPVFKAHCMRYVNGTTVLHLSKDALRDYTLYFPSEVSELKPVASLFEGIYREMGCLLDESRTLVEMRDTLLPKLMSGEIDVDKVEV